MRISEYFDLGKLQPSLDFVDVQVDKDTQLFIDPTALSLLDTDWGARSRSLIQDYFSLVLTNIREGKHGQARNLLSVLNEPNETRLGYSRDRPHGHGMGRILANKMWDALRYSTAVSSGIIQDLEDTALMIDGVSSDVISDIVTNILREQLLEYTDAMCKEYGIPVQEQIASKPIWDSAQGKWITKFVNQPVVNDERLLLVPKALVRKTITYQADNYYDLYLLERLQEEAVHQGFVRLLRNGESRPPTKKQLRERYGTAGKDKNRELTPGREDVLQQYKDDKKEHPREPLSHEKIATATDTPGPDWDDMLRQLDAIKPGNEGAKAYENIVKQIFAAIFYPWLMFPESQERIHQGRKIIDITYMNMAEDDFFAWLRNNYIAPYIIVECKNYNEDPNNPELDQLSSRFSPRRGQFGILACRHIEDRETFERRCRDTADDGRGFMIGIDDDDIRELINQLKTGDKDSRLQLLRDRFNGLVM